MLHLILRRVLCYRCHTFIWQAWGWQKKHREMGEERDWVGESLSIRRAPQTVWSRHCLSGSHIQRCMHCCINTCFFSWLRVYCRSCLCATIVNWTIFLLYLSRFLISIRSVLNFKAFYFLGCQHHPQGIHWPQMWPLMRNSCDWMSPYTPLPIGQMGIRQ